MADATAKSFDVRAAIARVAQADASLRAVGAALLPQVDGSAKQTWTRTSFANAAIGSPGLPGQAANQTIEYRTYSLGPSASYELDFWGANRAAQQRGGRQRAVQPLRPADGNTDHARQHGDHVVHGTRLPGPAGRRRTEPARRRGDPAGDPGAAGGRHCLGTRCRARGGAGRRHPRHAAQFPQPARPAGGGARGVGRPAAGKRPGAGRHVDHARAAGSGAGPALDAAGAPAGRRLGGSAVDRAERQHPCRPRGVLSDHHADRLRRLAEHRIADAAAAAIGAAQCRRQRHADDLRQRQARRAIRPGQGALRRTARRLPQGGDAGVHRRGNGADRMARNDRAGAA